MVKVILLRIIFALVSGLVLMSHVEPSAGSEYIADILYEWTQVEFDWPSEDIKNQYLADGRYDPTHNFISGVKVFKGSMYLTTPRLMFTKGVPSTLNKVIHRGNESVLAPYPDWAAQELGNCSALQCVMSMEVDPLDGFMYIMDTGRSGVFGNTTGQTPPVICPPKLVVYNLNDGSLVRSHNFPEDLVSNTTNFLNDIVLDRGNSTCTRPKWVYMTDATDSKLVVFNLDTNETHIIQHASMNYEPGEPSNITVQGTTYTFKTPIDGLAISRDFKYIYYCALGSRKLYQVPSSVVREKGADFAGNVRLVGEKTSQTGGMTYATDNLYYGALANNSVYKWEITKDAQAKGGNFGLVDIKTETELVKDDKTLIFPDSFTVGEDQQLYFTACHAHLFLRGGMDFTGANGPIFRVFRVNISERSYLDPLYGSGNQATSHTCTHDDQTAGFTFV